MIAAFIESKIKHIGVLHPFYVNHPMRNLFTSTTFIQSYPMTSTICCQVCFLIAVTNHEHPLDTAIGIWLNYTINIWIARR